MKTPLHILHLEDDANDAKLVQTTLEAAGIACATTCVQTRDDFVAALERGGIDLILSDFSLPGFGGNAALEIVRTKCPAIPFIFVSGTLGEERAIDSFKSGATDYVLKKRMLRLVPAVHRAMLEVEGSAQRRHAEDAASHERRFSEAALNSLPGVFYLFDHLFKFLRWNKNFEKITGYSSDEIARMSLLDFFTGAERDYIAERIQAAFENGSSTAEARLTGKDGTSAQYYFTGQRIQLEGTICIIGTGIDLTERNSLQAQFIEAQKMEVVGHLAGGIAHDFNNLIGVIMGYSDLITMKLPPDDPTLESIEPIRNAAKRAAGLTRQLLVFSRNQIVQPVVLDLNEVVASMDKILQRLVDENIDLKITPEQNIGHIKADSGYVGQLLMNLVVNARDAMPTGGKLMIVTKNVVLGEGQVCAHQNISPGNYVALSVTDTGTGMTDEVKAHLFEAFFTTKPKGKGTGLGLATCNTIVELSGGHIGVESELGKGTTFKIYFPRVEQPLDIKTEFLKKDRLPNGTETLLVVEDEPSVRHLACSILESQGYNILRANNGQEGLRVARECKGEPIRLVITDVIMPQMGGKVMAEWLKESYPNIRILFTSGYTDDSIAHHGVLDSCVEFLPKPYTPGALARKVREMLDDEIPKAANTLER